MKLLSLLLAALLAATALPAGAQAWPDKPIRMVLPYPPGGNVDGAARIISAELQTLLKQPVIVDNKPGAGGMIAAELVIKSPPDGYTFFMGANGPILYAPLIFRKNNYEWKRDFAAVGSVSFTPLVLQVNPGVPYKTAKEFFAAAKAKPGAITMASPGAGTTNHLVSEYMQRVGGMKWVTVHYRGNAPATTDVIGGQVQFNFDQLSVALPFIQNGRTRALAVTSLKRLPDLPDVPTLHELGFRNFSAETFTGIMAPAGTPKEIVQQMSAALQKVLGQTQVRARFAVQGAQARAMTPTQFHDFLKNEDALWSNVIRISNITAE